LAMGWRALAGAGGPHRTVLVRMGVDVKVARHPVIGCLVWAVLLGALLAWEGLGLAGVSDCPTLVTSSG
jgi:hypothetical protein